MVDRVIIDEGQMQKLISAINTLSEDTLDWGHIINTALPVFLAALLGVLTGLFLDWLKTGREKEDISRQRRENELTVLSGAHTAIVFDIEATIHVAMQIILPHFEASQAANAALQGLARNTISISQFNELLHSKFEPMVTRSPDIYLEEVNLFRDVNFILKDNADLIKISGWIITSIDT